jgi:hypothetical protein
VYPDSVRGCDGAAVTVTSAEGELRTRLRSRAGAGRTSGMGNLKEDIKSAIGLLLLLTFTPPTGRTAPAARTENVNQVD